MTDLFNTPVLLIHQPSPRLDYQITDAQGGALAHTVQVVGERKSAVRRLFSAGDKAQVVLQVIGLDGAPLFFIDRPAQQRAAAMARQPPCFVVAPNGTLIGRVEQDSRGFAQSLLAARSAGTQGYTQVYHLFDARNGLLCELTQTPVTVRRAPDGTTHGTGGELTTYTDANQVRIATLEVREAGTFAKSYGLRLEYRLPDPLRVLVIASPIAMLLMGAAIGGW